MKRAPEVEFRIGLGSCGIARGGSEVRRALEDAIREVERPCTVKVVGCNGMCHCEPIVEVVNGKGSIALYGQVSPGAAREIVTRHLGLSRWRERGRSLLGALLGGRNGAGAEDSVLELDRFGGAAGAYLGKQERVVLENCGEIDPLNIDDYLARGGYRALERCLESMSPDLVIERIKASGLRGRGGAGFRTGLKWEIARSQPGDVKYVICNGDEGDPGAFMDRLVLEADPHRVLEGLAIAAWAVGSSIGYLYIRAEYPHAVSRVREAIRRAEERGFLGERILGTDFSLGLQVREGAGAFVCGEETALIASLEGRRGMPRLRPPFPVQSGLRGKPTTINNVETLACVPWIVRNGPERFAAFGTESSKGTKVFALAGKIRRGGLIEVPMGITIREIVEEIGGGIENDRAFKAVQIGGPAGGCLPASLADTPIDYEELARTGAIMGSGGLVVLDETDCMVDIARFFLQFTQAESCGKCTFCRIGTKRMLEILERICAGRAELRDLEDLEDLATRVKRASLCGLGQAAPNPVLTTLRFFREEYEAHVIERRCPAGRCKELIHFVVNEQCTGCTLCAQVCPVDAIEYRPYRRHFVEDDLCTRCGSCLDACKDDAIEII